MFQRVILGIALALGFSINAQGAEYIVKTKSANGMVSAFQVNGVALLDFHQTGQLVKVDLDESREMQALAELQADPNVEYVVKNFEIKALRAPMTIQALREQWAIQKVRAEKAWSIAGNRGSRNITIAVIDTGIDYNHESLKANMVPGFDYLSNDSDPMDETSAQNPGHGTHCAGILGATGDMEQGTIGLSPEVSIMPLRFLGADGRGDLMAGIRSIDHAIEKGAQVISASWGAAVPRSQATPLIEAVQRADDAGVIFVAAAANDGANNDVRDMFPANAGTPNMIAVAASGSQDEKPQWSNYGKATVDLSAPGLNIMSTLPGNTYKELSGTSMATPLVSGLVALLKAQDMSLTGAQIRSILQTTGVNVDIETACDCRVDAANAVEAVKNKAMTVVPAAKTLKPGETFQFSTVYSSGAVKFTSSNTAAATIDANGLLTAVADGETFVTATDSAGTVAKSLSIIVKEKTEAPGGQCPLGDQQFCDLLCGIMPQLPFCM